MSASFRAPRRHRIKKVCSRRSRTIARAGVLPGPTAASCTATARLPWVFLPIALTGFALNQSFSLTVTLGQDYLPSRIGTSSGVTLGLAISIEHQVPARRMMGLRPHHQPEDSDRHRASAKLFTSTNLSNQPMQRLLARLGWRSGGIVYGLDEGDPELFLLAPTGEPAED